MFEEIVRAGHETRNPTCMAWRQRSVGSEEHEVGHGKARLDRAYRETKEDAPDKVFRRTEPQFLEPGREGSMPWAGRT